MEPNGFLEISADESAGFLEVDVSAAMGNFAGSAYTHGTRDDLMVLADGLEGYPRGNEQLSHTWGNVMSDNYISLRFEMVGIRVYCSVLLRGQRSVDSPVPAQASFAFPVDPAAIDIFQKQLLRIGRTGTGVARLEGR